MKLFGKYRFTGPLKREIGTLFLDYSVFETPWLSLGFHLFSEPDFKDEAPHDHARWFVSVALWGGYTERIWKDPAGNLDQSEEVRRRFLTAHLFKKEWAHNIIELHRPRKGKVVTLFIVGKPPKRLPQYYTKDGVKSFMEYHQIKSLRDTVKRQREVLTDPEASAIIV